MIFIGIFMVLLIPLLVWNPPSKTQLYWIGTILPIAIITTTIIRNKFDSDIQIKEEISNGIVEVIHVKTQRAIKREDPEDFGIAFYLDVIHEGVHKTLYLWGQYLDDLEYENQFPNTEFEIAISAIHKETLDIKLMGKHFKPEKTLEPFNKAVWKKGDFPLNGQLIDKAIDDIT